MSRRDNATAKRQHPVETTASPPLTGESTKVSRKAAMGIRKVAKG